MNNATSLATVIVPCYNSPDLSATLRSVLTQDYPRIELILIDDGSANFHTEEAEAFLEENRRGNLERFQVIANPRNLGTVRTLNIGLQHSTGAYIFTLAGDDCFYDDRVLSDWVAAFIRTGAAVMTGYREICDETLSIPLERAPTEAQVRKIKTYAPQALFEDLCVTNYIFGCCTARTAEAVKKHGLFDEAYQLIEDHPMNLKLLRSGEPIVFFDRSVVNYRSGGASAPVSYNPRYAADVDRIMEREVLPYTAHPIRRRVSFFLWKRDQKLLRRRALLLQKHSRSKPRQLLVQMWYYLHHPLRTLLRLPQKLLRLCKGGNNCR